MATTTSQNTPIIRFIILEDGIPYDWDDYGVFGAVLYDIANRKIVTTKYGHGVDMDRDGCVSLECAEQYFPEILKVMLNSLNIVNLELMKKIALSSSREYPTAIPVNVIGGRKFKGEGYLIYGVSTPVMYGLGAYQNQKNYYPVIFDPKTGTENVVNSFGYLKIDKEFFNNYEKTLYENIKPTIRNIKKIAHAWAYDMSYSACDVRNRYNLLQEIGLTVKSEINVPEEVTKGIEKLVEEKNRQKAERLAKLKEEKMPGIIEWVKTHTNKQGDEIMELAEHIFKKHNC